MSWPGGKGGSGVAQQLICLMPPHDVYIEPFLGGGAVLRAKRPARLNIGLDRSPTALYQTMLQLGDLAPDLLAMRDRADAEIPWAADIAGHIDVSGDGIQLSCQRPSPTWALLEDDAIEWLKENHARMTPQTLIYCDPPYVRSARRGTRNLYEYEMTDEQHVQLLDVLKSLPCMVLLSGYSSQLYEQALPDWNTSTYTTTVRSGAQVTEHVWFNYPRPIELHDYRYLGKNFRERERIKRKMKRWRERLERMPELEKQALLWAMKPVE